MRTSRPYQACLHQVCCNTLRDDSVLVLFATSSATQKQEQKPKLRTEAHVCLLACWPAKLSSSCVLHVIAAAAGAVSIDYYV
jgi:hypothetical protein